MPSPTVPPTRGPYATTDWRCSAPIGLRPLDEASRLDPTDPIAPAYAGWIVYLAGLPEQALPRLATAIEADPSYPDARFFRGMVLLRGRDDEAGARLELDEFVRLAPPSSLFDQVQAVLDSLERPSSSTTTSPDD